MDDNATYVSTSTYIPSMYEESIFSNYTKKSVEKRKENIFTPQEYIIYRKVDGKKKQIKLHNTPQYLNSHIINAVSGIPYYNDKKSIRYILGTEQEDDVFIVKFMSGENNIPPILLCYDSPEQYEKHTQSVVSKDIKESWRNKNARYRQKMLKRLSKY
jgi:hypothetical protein